MPEAKYCSAHQRYLRADGTCVTCVKIKQTFVEIEMAVREFHKHDLDRTEVKHILDLCAEGRSAMGVP